MKRVLQTFLASLLLAAAGAALAQAWPTKPVRVLVGQPPGAGPDIMARLLADRLASTWGQPVIVENRAGGASIPGTLAAVQSAPDGYTFYMATGGVQLNAFTFKSLPYDLDKQLVPVAFIGKAPFMLSVHPSVPASNLAELVAYLKANPGKLAIATEGPRSLGGLMTEYFMAVTGTKMVHVPHNGAAAGLTATIAGQTQVTMQSATATTPHAKAGKLRPIAVTSGSVVPGFESVPPLKQTYPDFEYVGWYMLYAPTGTPAPIVQRVNRDLDRIMKEPETAKKLEDLGPVLEGAGTPESLRQFHREENVRWARLVKAINLQPE
jgi:tripartite-type tricarboxylate transporter receptor subunit TctC